MKKSFIMMLTLLASCALWAEVEINGITYDLNGNEATARARYIGKYTGEVVIPETVEYNNDTYRVTGIRGGAFYECQDVTKITLPNSIKTIGDRAFYGCTGISTITIPDSVSTINKSILEGCTNLTEVTIGKGVKEVIDDAFKDDENITKVTWNAIACGDIKYSPFYYSRESITSVVLGEGVKRIPGNLCWSMSNLEYINIPSTVTYIGYDAFYDCVKAFGKNIVIPDQIDTIGRAAFMGCKSVETVKIGTGLKVLGENAFTALDSLKEVEWNVIDCEVKEPTDGAYFVTNKIFGNQVEKISFGKQVKTIPDDLCEHMENLTEVTIPNSVKSIGNSAFYMCSGLKQIIIPNSVISIGDYAFANCYAVKRVEIGESLYRLGYDAFSYDKNIETIKWNAVRCEDLRYSPFYYACTYVSTFEIGQNVQRIPANLCWGMTKLKNFQIPDMVSEIGKDAFYNCTNAFTDLVLSNNIKKIGLRTFYNCRYIKSIQFGTKVEEIGDSAFWGCNKVDHMVTLATTAPTVYQNTLSAISQYAYLYVPASCEREYKINTYWSRFDIRVASADNTSETTVKVEADKNTATITWPIDANAETYVIEIKNGNEVFCRLTFNAQGQLQDIAFAPARGGTNREEATEENGGYRFTVTNLKAATTYNYEIDTKNSSKESIANYKGTFTTTGGSGLDEKEAAKEGLRKVMCNGEVMIVKEGKVFNVMGEVVGDR